MRTSVKLLLAAGVISTLTATVPASAQSFSFRVGDVAMGYDDGYYDRYHNWHRWRDAREHDWYRAHYTNSYRGWHHRGWRYDRDRDGIPNRFDRDRDNDGVPNWRDRHPDNPYR